MQKEFPELWQTYIDDNIKAYDEFHKYWVKGAEERRVPVFFFRFEDMQSNPYPLFKSMFEFIFGLENIEGTFIDHRIRKVLEEGKSKA